MDEKTLQRFWSRVDKSGPTPDHAPDIGQCWVWTGYVDRCGYGKVMVDRRKSLAHRVAYTAEYGPIPRGMCVCHHCDNPGCVRPGHLFAGSHAENMRDMGRKGRNAQPRGERSAHAKMTADGVLLARSDYARGSATVNQLAARYGMTRQSMTAVIKRKTWRHV